MEKKLLEVYHYPYKIRLGAQSDGGYVICKLEGDYDCYITCGVANEASFDRDFLNLFKNIGKNNSFAFDGTIKDYPWRYTKDITFIKKNISNFNDNNHTNLDNLINKYDKIFLSIDIEGGEYPWLLSLTQDKLQKFKQICIEFHGLNDNTWSSSLSDKIKCLNILNQTHYIMHAHGNNCSGIQNNIPDVLELTYVNKKYILNVPLKNKTLLPIKGLDYSNHSRRNDYILNKYPFVSKKLYDDVIEINNPIDNEPMLWYNNEFTINNWPDPNFQKKQKHHSLKYVLKKGLGVIDTCAHIGDYGLPLAKALINLNRGDIIVYCIEPTPSKCEFMENVKTINNLYNVKIICKGLYDKIGTFSVPNFGFAGTNKGKNTGALQWTPDKNGLEFTTLDHLYKSKEIGEIGFLWLDAQWSEEYILRGAKKYLRTCKPYILMEYWPVTKYHSDGKTILNAAPGNKTKLLNDKVFKKIFQENDIFISNEKNEFDYILLEFYKNSIRIGSKKLNVNYEVR